MKWAYILISRPLDRRIQISRGRSIACRVLLNQKQMLCAHPLLPFFFLKPKQNSYKFMKQWKIEKIKKKKKLHARTK